MVACFNSCFFITREDEVLTPFAKNACDRSCYTVVNDSDEKMDTSK